MFKHSSQLQPYLPPRRRLRISLYIFSGLVMGGTWIGLSHAALGQVISEKNRVGPTPQLLVRDIVHSSMGHKAVQQPLLQFGSEGEEVQRVQTLLQLLGYYPGTVDGRYQEETVIAVSAFQESAGLERDGILGPTTWAKLLPSVNQLSRTQETSPLTGTASTAPSSQTTTTPEATTVNTPQAAASAASSDSSDAEPTTGGLTTSSGATAEITLPTLRVGMRGPAVRNLQERLSSLGLLQGSIDGVFGSQTEESVKAAQRSFNLNDDGIVGPATWRALLQ